MVAATQSSVAGGSAAPAMAVAATLEREDRRARIVTPPSSLAAAWLRARSTPWVAVDVSGRSERLDRVWMPDYLGPARSIVLLNRLRPKQDLAEPIAIGVWARFAHPRQRTGAIASREHGGLAVDIALGVRPASILLVAGNDSLPVLFETDDQVAAELAGRAFLEHAAGPNHDQSGPWEDPAIQRATELGLGVRFPAEIHAEVRWIGEPGSSADAFHSRASHWLHRMGVAR